MEKKFIYTNKTCELICVDDIKVDKTYQRIARKTVKKIADNFDWRKFGVPTVSLRADGSYYVIDGQHRIGAAKLWFDTNNITDNFIWCDVLTGLSLPDEANLFAMQGDNRTAVTSLEKMLAALTTGDADNPYVYIHDAAKKHGLECVPVHSKYLGIRCIECLKKHYRDIGPDVVDYICRVIVEGGWDRNFDAFSQFWTTVLARCYQAGVDSDKLAAFLFKRLPYTVVQESPREGIKTAIPDVVKYLISTCK